jgi:hypothetical protein
MCINMYVGESEIIMGIYIHIMNAKHDQFQILNNILIVPTTAPVGTTFVRQHALFAFSITMLQYSENSHTVL